MSRAERRALVEREDPALPVSRQCRLLAVSRASVYRQPAAVSDKDLAIMALIDRQYLARPYYGSPPPAPGRAPPRPPGPPGQPQAGPATDAADRAGGGLSAAEHEQAGGRAQGLSLSARWVVDRSGQPGLVLGYHLYPDGQGVRVSGRDHGLAQSCSTGLAAVEHTRRRFLRRGARGSARSLWSAGDLQHRPEPALAQAGGSQFTSDEFTGVLSRHEITISMDGKRRYMDNIFVERLWRSLKYEEVYLNAYGNVAAAQAGIGAWLVFYNEERQHQSHGYRTPRQVSEAQCRRV